MTPHVSLPEEASHWIALAAPFGILVLDPAGRIQFANPAAGRLFGVDSKELTGQPAEGILAGWPWRESGDGTGKLPDGTQFPVHAEVHEAGDRTLVFLTDDAERRRLQALTAELLAAREEERRRVARELHDGPTQELALLAAKTALLQKKAPGFDHEFQELREGLQSVASDVRALAHQYHPSVLEHSGLAAALGAHCQEVLRHSGVLVGFRSATELGPIPKPVVASLYRIAQEALHNVVKHSEARSAAVVLDEEKASDRERVLKLTILDDGKGFVPEQARHGSGLGLVSIEERARLMDADLRITSLPGEGTRVEIKVPIKKGAAA